MLFSLSKSFTSTAVGFAVSEGVLSLEDSVLGFFPHEAPVNVSEHLAALRVCHLLTMTTGHDVDTWSVMMGQPDDNWIKAFLHVPVPYAPGTHFLYNTGATYMLSAIVQKVTGTALVEYLEPRLFTPLGITNATWDDSPQGINLGGIGLNLKTEDVARFGQFYLQKGQWQGIQLLPEAWIAEATAVHTGGESGSESDWAQGYGYQFWHCRNAAYRGDGVFGQFCIVMPEQDAVLVLTGGLDVLEMQQPLDLVWEKLLPAMQSAPVPEDHEAAEHLRRRLDTLALPLVQGEAQTAQGGRVSGCTYQMDLNPFNIETVALHFDAMGCMLSISTTTGTESFPVGYGQWAVGHTRLFNSPWIAAEAVTPAAASGAWTDEAAYTVVVYLYETPFHQTLIFHVDDAELLVETHVNVAFEPPVTHLLTGRAASNRLSS
ncbi:MAG: hypothetical protein OHK0046_29900 [Anaerolineae bacterium]